MAANTTTSLETKALVGAGLLLLSLVLAATVGRRFRLAGCLPFVALASLMRLQPGDPPQVLLWSAVLGCAWAAWSMLLFSLPGLMLKRRPVPALRWMSLVPWGVYLQLFLRLDFDDPGVLAKLYIRACWDPPLLWTAQVAQLFDHRFLRPFHSDIDDDITMGSLPMAQDVPWMKAHGVVGVINMCAEWAGPLAEYQQVGIKQLHLPTIDTTSPSVEALRRGVSFISQTLESARKRRRESGSALPRIFIHCKGGIGRAATMTMSWYIHQGFIPEEAMRMLKEKRPIVSESVLRYRALRTLAESSNGTRTWGGDPDQEVPPRKDKRSRGPVTAEL